jgi:hypothetical protein
VAATNVAALAAAEDFSLALRRDGTLLAWGRTPGLPPVSSNVVQMAAASSYALALQVDGTIVQWGTIPGNSASEPPPGLSNVVQVAAGEDHALALLETGTVVSWGHDDLPAPPANLGDVQAVAAGAGFSVALRSDGTVVEWGPGASVPPAEATNLVAIAAGPGHRVGLRADGSVISWPNSGTPATQTPADLPAVVAIAAGGSATLAVIPTAPEPRLARRPHDQSVSTGAPLRLEASVFPNATDVTYAWFRDGVALAGQTNGLLLIATGAAADSGRYSVRASNAYGSDTSREVRVLVRDQAPWIAAQPVQVNTQAGGPAAFRVSARGSPPLAYQWYFAHQPVPGATNDVLELGEAELSEVGAYHVVVTNRFGTVVSSTAELRILPAVSWAQDQFPVSTNGRFTAKVLLSEPLRSPVRVGLEYGIGTAAAPGSTTRAFLVIPAGETEQCAVIDHADLGRSISTGQPGYLRLADADPTVVLASPEAAVLTSANHVLEASCGRIPPEAPRLLPGRLLFTSNGSVELTFMLPHGQPFHVEASVDLRTWFPVAGTYAIDPDNDLVWFIEEEPYGFWDRVAPSGYEARFYRVIGD